MKKKAFVVLLTALILPNFGLSTSLEKDLQISLEEKQIQDFSSAGLTLVFYLRIKNSSSKTYYLSRYNYRFVANQKEYIRMQTSLDENLAINSQRDILITLPVKITYDHLFQSIPEFENEEKAQCYLMGELTFSDERKERGSLPIAFSGDFPIFKKPGILIEALKVNALTIGGADLNFEAKIKNRNGFDLEINRIVYSLKLGEYLVSEGKAGGGKNIEGYGERTFELPLLLNFFEVGKDLLAVLQQPSTSFRFSGEFEIRTAWGSLTVPFDENGKIVISRLN